MTAYHANKEPLNFVRPPGVIEMSICADSGTQPGPGCTNRVTELFAGDQPPLSADQDFLQTMPIDLWTNLIANENCGESIFQASFVSPILSSGPMCWDESKVMRQLDPNHGGWAGLGWSQKHRSASAPAPH